MSIILERETRTVSISKKLSVRLARFSKLAGFRSIDQYASYLLQSVLDEAESKENSRISPRWSGGNDDEGVVSQRELDQIKEELRAAIQVTC